MTKKNMINFLKPYSYVLHTSGNCYFSSGENKLHTHTDFTTRRGLMII